MWKPQKFSQEALDMWLSPSMVVLMPIIILISWWMTSTSPGAVSSPEALKPITLLPRLPISAGVTMPTAIMSAIGQRLSLVQLWQILHSPIILIIVAASTAANGTPKTNSIRQMPPIGQCVLILMCRPTLAVVLLLQEVMTERKTIASRTGLLRPK